MRSWAVAITAVFSSCAPQHLTPALSHSDSFCYGVTFGTWSLPLPDVHHWGADTAYATGHTRYFAFTPVTADVAVGFASMRGLVGWELGGLNAVPGLWRRLDGDTLTFDDGEPFEQLTLRFNPGTAERTGYARFEADDRVVVAPFSARRVPCDSVPQVGRRGA